MTVRNSFAGLPAFLFGDGGLHNQLVCDVRTYVRANDGSRDLLAPMLAWSPGPPAIGDTGDNSPGHMMGTTWLLQVCPDGSWVLYREERGRLEVIPWDDPPDLVTPTARHISLCFDQAARVVLAWEDQGIIRVRRWDIEQNQYIENVSFAGHDPVVVFDAQWAYQIPGSDVLLFYLSPDRTRVLCRVQRDVYAVEYEVWDYGGGGGGDEHYQVFTESGTWDWSAAGQPETVDVLVVAGGGGGGSRQGGGGGAGGVVIQSAVPVDTDVSVTVGAGGEGNLGGGRGANGENSSFGAVLAVGGGGGGGRDTGQDGASGGSGGGAAGGSLNGGAGTPGQGHAGGAANPQTINSAGGGGGANAEGGNARDIFPQEFNEAGDGGDGVTLEAVGWGAALALGAPPAVGGGGGGGVNSTGTSPGVGGAGGGGDGQLGTTAGYPTSGAQNTGGGGGGSGLDTIRGGDGGSGLVIVRWRTNATPQPVILDRVIALPYRYQVLVSDSTGAPLPSVLVSALYPVPTFVRLAGDGVVQSGAYDQVAEALTHQLFVTGDGVVLSGLYEAPFSGIRHDLALDGDGSIASGRYRNVVTTYEPTIALDGDGVIHSGDYPQTATALVHTVTVEGDGQIVGGTYATP